MPKYLKGTKKHQVDTGMLFKPLGHALKDKRGIMFCFPPAMIQGLFFMKTTVETF